MFYFLDVFHALGLGQKFITPLWKALLVSGKIKGFGFINGAIANLNSLPR
jgi:hypothetical protein